MPASLPTPPPAAPAPAFANGVPVPGVLETAATSAAAGSPLGPLAGAAMDRRVPKRRFTPRRIALALGALAVVALVLYLALGRDGRRSLRVEGDRLTVSDVRRGAFQEFVAVTGTVAPERSVYLDAVVGGQVAERLVEEGAFVAAGQPLLVLKNEALTLQTLASEAGLQEQISAIRSQRLALDQNALNLAQQLVELDYNIVRLRRERDRLGSLVERGLAPAQEYEAVRDEHEYTARRRALTREGHRQDSLSRAMQLVQMNESLGRLSRNLDLVQGTTANLVVRAPLAGQLTALSAEVGEQKGPGARLGQVDVLDAFRVRVAVDEHYLARVAPGQAASATVDGRDYGLAVTRVYPEVREGRFEIDLGFAGPAPASVRRGQTLRVRLELGAPETALLLARGGFYQKTGGNWAYVLAPGGARAERRTIRLGRQNPGFYEVTEGLRAGDRVVTSSYDAFGDADVLVLR